VKTGEGNFAASEPAANSISLELPAVDRDGNGAMALLQIQAAKGNGQVFLRMDSQNPVVSTDTQESLRIAIDVVKKIVGSSLQDVNLYYSISSESQAVGGGSAGAAIAVATISLLRQEPLRADSVITGTVQEDGSIGQVGKILAKAQIAKQRGYSIILVPKGEAVQTIAKQQCTTRKVGPATVEKCSTVFEQVDVARETGMQVIEVSSVQEAYSLMKK
jgi:uncharacterized protein